MSDLFVTYGPDVVSWVLAALGTALTALVFSRWRSGILHDILQRAWVEIQGAVLEVNQTYADAIKAGRADGTLSDDERAAAKAMAIGIAKSNLGSKGLKRIARILGLDVDGWIASKTEQAVKLLAEPKLIKSEALDPTKPTAVPR